MYITCAPDSRWNNEILGTLDKVSAGDFEAVYTGETVTYNILALLRKYFFECN
jgi:hypothetical protein